MIRPFVSLAFLAGWATAHPQCFINDRYTIVVWLQPTALVRSFLQLGDLLGTIGDDRRSPAYTLARRTRGGAQRTLPG